MHPSSFARACRQLLQTERLLGVDAVPVRASGALGAAAEANRSAEPPPSPDDAAPPQPAGAPRGVAFPTPAGATKLQVLEALDRDQVRACTRCPLCRGRTQTVFGEGDPDAALMFIGEAPGAREDELGRPFVGDAGQLLDKMIAAMGLRREQVYIANTVKCRPPANRVPTPQETAACWPFLQQQIQTIRPRVIVTLGAPATKLILGTVRGITSIRGVWHQLSGVAAAAIPVMPTFHPAYLLRNYTTDVRAKVWSDLRQVMERLKA